MKFKNKYEVEIWKIQKSIMKVILIELIKI